MKYILSLLMLTYTAIGLAQKEGQRFCGPYDSESYFPLDIEKKKLLWSDTYYFEDQTGTKTLDGMVYKEYVQSWKDGTKDTLYLRESKGVVYQYEACCDEERLRFDPSLKVGDSWSSPDGGVKYTLVSYNDILKTPYCVYKNLMCIKADYGELVFKFYYQKGYGYIGARGPEGELASCATPEW